MVDEADAVEAEVAAVATARAAGADTTPTVTVEVTAATADMVATAATKEDGGDRRVVTEVAPSGNRAAAMENKAEAAETPATIPTAKASCRFDRTALHRFHLSNQPPHSEYYSNSITYPKMGETNKL